jgi:hypothetical protein
MPIPQDWIIFFVEFSKFQDSDMMTLPVITGFQPQFL